MIVNPSSEPLPSSQDYYQSFAEWSGEKLPPPPFEVVCDVECNTLEYLWTQYTELCMPEETTELQRNAYRQVFFLAMCVFYARFRKNVNELGPAGSKLFIKEIERQVSAFMAEAQLKAANGSHSEN